MKKFFIVLTITLFSSFFLSAQATNTIADCLFISAEGLGGAASYYKGSGLLGKFGLGAGAELGYNMNDVLFSIKYQYYTGPKAALGKNKKVKIEQNFWFFQISKIFKGKNSVVDFRPSLGWGANVINTSFVQASNSQKYEVTGVSLAANVGLYLDIIKMNYVKPYFGVEGNISFDNSSFLIAPYGVIGLRIATF